MKLEVPSWVYDLLFWLNTQTVWYIYTLPMLICLCYFAFILGRQKQDGREGEKKNYMIQYFDTYWDVVIAIFISVIPILNWFITICILNSFLNKRV